MVTAAEQGQHIPTPFQGGERAPPLSREESEATKRLRILPFPHPKKAWLAATPESGCSLGDKHLSHLGYLMESPETAL